MLKISNIWSKFRLLSVFKMFAGRTNASFGPHVLYPCITPYTRSNNRIFNPFFKNKSFSIWWTTPSFFVNLFSLLWQIFLTYSMTGTDKTGSDWHDQDKKETFHFWINQKNLILKKGIRTKRTNVNNKIELWGKCSN